MKVNMLMLMAGLVPVIAWGEPQVPISPVLVDDIDFAQNSLAFGITGNGYATPTPEEIALYDVADLIGADRSGKSTPGVIYFNNPAYPFTDINFYGLAGFYLASGFSAPSSGSVKTNIETGTGITSIYNFGDYLYYLASGSSLYGWENNISQISGEGRIVWVGAGASIGDVINDAGMTLSSQTTAMTFSGDVSSFNNQGTITAATTALEITDTGNVGSVNNSGTITATNAVENAGTISGAVTNTGTITGNINNTGSIGGGIANSGTINGEIANLGTISGTTGLLNVGNLNGSFANLGVVEGDILNTESGVVNGTIANGNAILGSVINVGIINGISFPAEDNASTVLFNTGTISGSVTNTGTLNGDITNTGTISGGITNYGIINGNVALGDASMNLAGSRAAVSGTITGSSASSITIGMANEAAAFNAINTATVGSIDVVRGSTLSLADDTQWTATNTSADAISNGGILTLGNGSQLNGSLTNNGTLSLSGETRSSSILNGSLVNIGALVLDPTATSAGNTLTINGDYTGTTGSTVSLGSVLAGDDSLTDRLVITGNTSGSSTLYVANENGSGAQTLEGIQLIEVDGNSDADFTLGNRVVAGAYDYSLRKGNTSGSDDAGWYLSSYLEQSDGDGGGDQPGDDIRAVRPEVGSYIANLQAANSMFAMSLHDRVGETQYIDPLTGETSSLWLRQVGGRNKSSLSDGQNKTSANRYVVQLGGDVLQLTGDAGKLNAGIMGGYADQKSKTRNSLTGYRSEGSINGYSAGIYATWYQDQAAKSGLYVDSWLQYAWFDNEVKGQDLSPETYNSKGLMASVETGYDWQVSEWSSNKGMQNSVWIQPHGQVTWSGIKADDHTESNGTKVTASGQDNVQLRLGMRTYLNGKSSLDKNTGREFQPFVEANWIYNTRQYGATLGGTDDNVQGTRNAGELKAGVEGKITSALSVWTNVAQVMGGKGYNDTQGTLGLRYQF